MLDDKNTKLLTMNIEPIVLRLLLAWGKKESVTFVKIDSCFVLHNSCARRSRLVCFSRKIAKLSFSLPEKD